MNKAPYPTSREAVETIAEYLKAVTGNFRFPTAVQSGDETLSLKAPDIFRQRLPDSKSPNKTVPYIIARLVTGIDKQVPGNRTTSTCVLRLIFAVYSPDEQEGAMMLLELIDTVKAAILRDVVIGGRFKIDKDAGIEYLIYEVDSAPYYGGEMMLTVEYAAIERSVNYGFNEEKRYSFDAFETET